MNRAKFLVFLLLLSLYPAYAFTIDQIHDPRPQSWVIDDKNYLSEDSRNAINSICRDIKDSGDGEIMVVVIDKIGNEEHHRFATSIFNRLGIGKKETNRGILLYAALEEHAAEIILGDGVDSDADIALSDRIMQNTIIPYFKKGESDNALYYGAVECAEKILRVQLRKTTMGEGGIDTIGQSYTPPVVNSSGNFLEKNEFKPLKGNSRVIANIIVCGIFYILLVRPFLKLRPRKCPKCRKKMVRLNEVEDDAFLTEGEIAEEHCESVNYDIWYCNDCKETKKVKRSRFFSKISKCPKCKYKTLRSKSRIIHHATHSHEGLGEMHLDCQNCSYTRTSRYTIARITESDNSSSGSYSSGSSSSSGGSSSGSGSSGRW
jgi:uncharacterized protein